MYTLFVINFVTKGQSSGDSWTKQYIQLSLEFFSDHDKLVE